jgi:photosystem II stability/assembly factor-like uncharacterized protein
LAGLALAICAWPASIEAQAESCRMQAISLAVDPRNSSVVYAGSIQDGLLRSTDAGQTWTPLAEPRIDSVSSIAIDRADPARIFLSTYEQFLHGSTDGGASWTLLSQGIPVPPCGGFPCNNRPEFLQIAIDPSFPMLLFARSFSGVYRSEDAGRTWTQLDFGQANPLLQTDTRGASPFPIFYFDDDFASNPRLRKSLDRGVTWTTTRSAPPFHIESLQTDPTNPVVAYAGTSKGIYKSTDGGETWIDENVGLPLRFGYALNIEHLTLDRRVPGTIYAAADTSHVFKSVDAGATWTSSSLGLEATSVNTVVIDPADSSVLYATGVGVYKSTDAGKSWKPSFALGGTLPAIVGVDPPELFEGQRNFINADGSSGGAYLVLKGTGFSNQSSVLWNGSSRPTIFESCVRLSVDLSPDDVKWPGTAEMTVINPGGSASSAFPVRIRSTLQERRPIRGRPRAPRGIPPR